MKRLNLASISLARPVSKTAKARIRTGQGFEASLETGKRGLDPPKIEAVTKTQKQMFLVANTPATFAVIKAVNEQSTPHVAPERADLANLST